MIERACRLSGRRTGVGYALYIVYARFLLPVAMLLERSPQAQPTTTAPHPNTQLSPGHRAWHTHRGARRGRHAGTDGPADRRHGTHFPFIAHWPGHCIAQRSQRYSLYTQGPSPTPLQPPSEAEPRACQCQGKAQKSDLYTLYSVTRVNRTAPRTVVPSRRRALPCNA